MVCYEDLFVLERGDGRLLWSFDPGPYGVAWPTIADERIYVGTRRLPEQMSASGVERTEASPSPSLVRISRDEFGKKPLVLELVTTDAVPADAVAWSPLSRLPAPSEGSESIIIELIDLPIRQFYSRLEIGGILARHGVAYLKLGEYTDRIVVQIDGVQVAETLVRELPASPTTTPAPVATASRCVGSSRCSIWR
ncbi:MAG: hypothetical protein GY716_16190 [bacterium]|nr:hypothetical protein [bacterium]